MRGIKDPHLIAAIGSFARPGNYDYVQYAAMNALQHIGPQAVRAAKADIDSALADPQVSPRAKAAAVSALTSLQESVR